MQIAYLVNQYPKTSHTFIRREILAMERLGFTVMRIALRGWDEDLVEGEDDIERERTRYVLRNGLAALSIAVVQAALKRPRRFCKAIALAMQLGYRSDRPLVVHLAYLAEACRIEAWLREARIQHLHAHFGTNSAEVALLIGALGGPAWSFTVHGPEEFDKPHALRLAEKVRHARFVVAISSYGRSQLFRWADPQDWPKVHVVHCGVEPKFLTPRAANSSPVPHRFVCVGRLSAQKGQLMLLEAAKLLQNQGTDFEIVLAGDGEMRSPIETYLRGSNLKSKVHVTGWIDGNGVREHILAARAVVLPSFAEGLPVALMEAMALRRPIISTFVAGIPELVRPGENGWLVAAGDVEALAKAMTECLNTPIEALDAMGDAAHARVAARHDIDKEAAKLAGLFRRQQLRRSPHGRQPTLEGDAQPVFD